MAKIQRARPSINTLKQYWKPQNVRSDPHSIIVNNLYYIAMNFDRIQKLRSQRTTESLKSQQTNPQVKSKEVFSTNNRK